MTEKPVNDHLTEMEKELALILQNSNVSLPLVVAIMRLFEKYNKKFAKQEFWHVATTNWRK